jgi:hypothetical protein
MPSKVPQTVLRAVGGPLFIVGGGSLTLMSMVGCRLAQEDGHTVSVEYNIFSDFGKERSYNVRSVDGILLNNGDHVIKDAERFSGEIQGSGNKAATCWLP